MRSILASLLLAASAAVASEASASQTTTTTTTAAPACTAYSHTSGAYFDLRPAIAIKPEDGKSRNGATEDYHAKGYDYGRNFTLNICGPVVDPVQDVVGLGKDAWGNVSAYYTYKGEVYSIGQQSLDLNSHGRMLVLQYTDGSPCGEPKSASSKEKSRTIRTSPEETSAVPLPDMGLYDTYITEEDESTPLDGDGDGDGDDDEERHPRRKSATISLHCDPEHIGSQVGVSFVGADPDDCAYFFEVRSQHACARAEPHQPGSVGPGSVFAIILGIAVLVYFGGGIFYQRTVAHARGWRQLPNYNLWAGIWSFICDTFVSVASSCGRLLPGRRPGYSSLAGSPSRSRNRDDENRLIDQLDEEWDD